MSSEQIRIPTELKEVLNKMRKHPRETYGDILKNKFCRSPKIKKEHSKFKKYC